MEAYILDTARRLLREAPKRTFFKDLRASCDILIQKLQQRPENAREDTDADKYFDLLKSALDTKHPRVMDVALNSILYLTRNGYLKGRKILSIENCSHLEKELGLPSIMKIRTMMDLIICRVCICADDNDDTRSTVIIDILSAAIQSTNCSIHNSILLFVVQTCFQINLMARSTALKKASKDCLVTIFTITGQRMESEDTLKSSKGIDIEADDSTRNITKDAGQSPGSSSRSCSNNSSSDQGVSHQPSPVIESEDARVNGNEKASNSNSEMATNGEEELNTFDFISVLHSDTYMLFRHVCALSMKGSDDHVEGNGKDSISMQTKILSLEIVLMVLQQSGPAFRSGEPFVFAVRQHLCVSLLGNCTSEFAQVTGLSLQIFNSLLVHFKEHLKDELEVFVTTIFLRILESENSTFDHKMSVLEVFHSMCNDGEALIEIFINYDCDLEEIDLFRRIVDALAKIAKNPSLPSLANRDFMTGGRKAAQEEAAIREECLKALVVILRSLKQSSPSNDSPISVEVARERSVSGGRSASPILDAGSSSNENGNSNSVSQFYASKTASASYDSSGADLVSELVLDDGTGEIASGTVEVFDKKKKRQKEIESGILKFNMSPRKGISYLASLGHIEMTPESVAAFLKQYSEKLDKTIVGDYLGKEKEYQDGFCLKVLHAFVDDLDFSNMLFDDAIRHFLSFFRLPGEAQKIDRMMEKFAERYYLQNRSVFASADMAFILAFSTIMLQTNLHNPAIRDDKRMTVEQFIKQNKGISTDGELPEELLVGIYERIQSEPITLSGINDTASQRKNAAAADTVSALGFTLGGNRRRKSAFKSERREMVRAGEALIREKAKKMEKRKTSAVVLGSSSGTGTFQRAGGHRPHDMYVKPMLEVVWPAMLAVFSQVLETQDDVVQVDLCLDGLEILLSLCARLDMPTARDAMVNSLCKNTTLETVKIMTSKNVEAIKRLINITLSDGDYLDDTWLQFLQCFSHLELLLQIGNGTRDAEEALFKGNTMEKRDRDQLSKLFNGPSKEESIRRIEEANGEVLDLEIDSATLDRIFTSSQYFSAESLSAFIQCLCTVSLMEISSVYPGSISLRGEDHLGGSGSPRVFSLQKLVEVSDINMFKRSRLEWTHMWGQLADHFTKVGLHPNKVVAMCAIDSLKQLSIKFLQKDELNNFNFQRLFLKPFEVIISKSTSPDIQELILDCAHIMLQACASKMRSGWKSLLAILEVTAGVPHKSVTTKGFFIVKEIVEIHFDLLLFDFVDIMHCLTSFAGCRYIDISLDVLTYFIQSADKLACGAVQPHLQRTFSDGNNPNSLVVDVTTSKSASDSRNIKNVVGRSKDDENAPIFGLWWPLLLGLSTLIADPRVDVRLKAVGLLEDILCKHYTIFGVQTWSVILKGVLFPIVENAKIDETVQPYSAWPSENPFQSKDPQSWIGSTAGAVFNMILHVLQSIQNDPELLESLVPETLNLFVNCINQEIESLARLALRALQDMLLNLPSPLCPGIMNAITSSVESCVMQSLALSFGSAGYLNVAGAKNAPSCLLGLTRCPVALKLGFVTGIDNPNHRHRYSNITNDAANAVPEESVQEQEKKKITDMTVNVSFPEAKNILPAGTQVNTPYGAGVVTHYIVSSSVEPSVESLRRARVELTGWTAVLYTNERLMPLSSPQLSLLPASTGIESISPRQSEADTEDEGFINEQQIQEASNRKQRSGSEEVAAAFQNNLDYSRYSDGDTDAMWMQLNKEKRNRSRSATPGMDTSSEEYWYFLSQGIMTSMVSSLEMCRLMGETVHYHLQSWDASHCKIFLDMLGAVRCHAREFNSTTHLRKNLHERDFMKFSDNERRLPHLIEHEVLAVTQQLLLTMELYSQTNTEQKKRISLAHSYLAPLVTDVCEEYLAMDRVVSVIAPALPSSPLSLSIDEYHGVPKDSHDVLLKERMIAFSSPVAICLRGLAQITREQFKQNVKWLAPLLSDMTLVSNDTVRACVKEVMDAHVVPILQEQASGI